jgi:molybdate transport system permease protein
MNIDFLPFFVSIKLSVITTLILLIICFPLAILIGGKKFRLKPVAETIISLPLVLPPTVIGFYLLMFLSPRWIIGSFFENVFNVRLVFSFTGIVIASCVYSFPFMIQPLKNGIEAFDRSLLEASYSLGKSKIETFFRIIIPNIKTNIVTGIVMTFAHTMGEFGVILMIGGNISGQTRVASIAIYDKVEQLDYNFAYVYSIILVSISILILILLNLLNNRKKENLI